MVDPTFTPGRFDQHIHIPLPNASERGDIMMSLCRKIKFNNNKGSNLTNLNKEDLIAYAKSNACDGYSGAELKSFLHQKIMQVMKKRISA